MPGCVCPKVKDMGLASSEKISLKMGVNNLAASLPMGNNSCYVLCVNRYKSHANGFKFI